mmetsp:Transcript_37474/g.125409  ORF Transcript_37474/g.125409 Transcript_37474/m.125409 type:complete len:244 (-) Transcript_37474:577-1308(-)
MRKSHFSRPRLPPEPRAPIPSSAPPATESSRSVGGAPLSRRTSPPSTCSYVRPISSLVASCSSPGRHCCSRSYAASTAAWHGTPPRVGTLRPHLEPRPRAFPAEGGFPPKCNLRGLSWARFGSPLSPSLSLICRLGQRPRRVSRKPLQRGRERVWPRVPRGGRAVLTPRAPPSDTREAYSRPYPASVNSSNVLPAAAASPSTPTSVSAKSTALHRPTATSPCERKGRPCGQPSNLRPVGRTTQ